MKKVILKFKRVVPPTLLAFGRNNGGEFGLGNQTNVLGKIQTITNIDTANIKQIAVGFYSSYILMNNGTMYVAGHGGYKQLFKGDSTADQNLWTLSTITGIKKVIPSAKAYKCFLLLENNELWGAGFNSYGSLGIPAATTVVAPTKLLDNVKDVSSFMNHTIVLMQDKTIRIAGHNGFYQLGDITGTSYNNGFVNPGLTNVEEVATGSNYSIIRFSDGTVKGCGNNTQGQLGIPYVYPYIDTKAWTTVPILNVSKIVAGTVNTLYMLNEGTPLMSGQRAHVFAHLASQSLSSPLCPIPYQVSYAYTGNSIYLVSPDGTMRCMGSNEFGQLGFDNLDNTTYSYAAYGIPTKIVNIKQLSAGGDTCFALCK